MEYWWIDCGTFSCRSRYERETNMSTEILIKQVKRAGWIYKQSDDEWYCPKCGSLP